jgi:hypothetical protein
MYSNVERYRADDETERTRKDADDRRTERRQLRYG